MKISIIIPTYRPQSYIHDCLDSVAAQTLSKELYEVIVVLNGDKEPYWTELQSYQQEKADVHIRLFYSAQRGVSAARNMGVEEARGEYLCFMDDDDLVTPTYLQSLLRIASEDTVALSKVWAFEDGTDRLQPIYMTREFQPQAASLNLEAVRRNLYSACGKLIHRDIIADRRFDTSLQNGEDAQFMLLISDKIKSASFTDETAQYLYRQRKDSAFNKKRKTSYYLRNIFIRIGKALKIYLSHPFGYSLRLFLMYMGATVMGNIRQMRGISQLKTQAS